MGHEYSILTGSVGLAVPSRAPHPLPRQTNSSTFEYIYNQITSVTHESIDCSVPTATSSTELLRLNTTMTSDTNKRNYSLSNGMDRGKQQWDIRNNVVAQRADSKHPATGSQVGNHTDMPVNVTGSNGRGVDNEITSMSYRQYVKRSEHQIPVPAAAATVPSHHQQKAPTGGNNLGVVVSQSNAGNKRSSQLSDNLKNNLERLLQRNANQQHRSNGGTKPTLKLSEIQRSLNQQQRNTGGTRPAVNGHRRLQPAVDHQQQHPLISHTQSQQRLVSKQEAPDESNKPVETDSPIEKNFVYQRQIEYGDDDVIDCDLQQFAPAETLCQQTTLQTDCQLVSK